MCPPDCELSNSGFASRPGISCVSIGLREPKSQCLWLRYNTGNPDLTKAQIAELKKALPNCDIGSNPTK